MLFKLKYIFFGVLLMTAIFLAFRAGKQAVKHDNMPSQKLFKSFHQMKSSVAPEMTTEMTNDISVPKKKKIKKSKPKSKKEKVKEIDKKDLESRTQGNFKHYVSYKLKNKEIEAQDEFVEDAQTPKPEKSNAPEGASRLTASDQFQRVTVVNQAKGAQQNRVPSFTEVYIPVYTASNVNGLDTNGKSLVIERAIASTANASSYQILVYNEEGTQLLGAIQTKMSTEFPFQGLPDLQRVQGDLFEASTRFIIFSEEPSQDILQDSAHMESILESAYRSDLDKQTFIGVDPNYGLDVYTLFPGIYLGQDKR